MEPAGGDLGAVFPTSVRSAHLFTSSAVALSLVIGFPEPARADVYPSGDSTCASAGPETVGRQTLSTTGQPQNGGNEFSTVQGCGADGNNGEGVTVYGSNAESDGSGATAVGYNSAALGDWATALGLEAEATAVGATALGFGSQATAMGALAIGSAAGDGVTPLSLADSTMASGEFSIAIGANATRGAQAAGLSSIALGGEASANNENDIAIGTGAVATGDVYGSSMAIGARNRAEGGGAVALGYDVEATATAAVALGLGARATDRGAIALGDGASASGAQSIALAEANATEIYSIAIGSHTQATAEQAIAVGVYSSSTGGGAVALGAFSVAEGLLSLSALGTAYNEGSTALGNLAVAGMQGSASIARDTAVGDTATATGGESVALGYQSVASGARSVAIGSGAEATGINAISIGVGNVVSGNNSGALGDPNIVSGDGSYAFGNNNTLAQNNTFVVGNDVTTTQGNSVVLGTGSTDRAATAEGGVTLSGTAHTFAGVGAAANGVVSVGGVGTERQVINVASGRIAADSTDAINGSQLFATNSAINSLDSRVAQNTSDIEDLVERLASGSTGLVRQVGGSPGNSAITVGALSGGTSVSIAGTEGDRVLAGLADGVADNDAVTVRQLADAITSAVIGAGGIAYDNPGATSLTFNQGGASTTLRNVAAGNVAAGSTDAVNGSQLHSTNIQIAALNNGQAGAFRSNNTSGLAAPDASGADAVAGGFGAVATGQRSVALGANASATGQNSVALGYGSTDDGRVNVVSIGAVGAERQITNVAAGTRVTDAVNLGQLNTGLADTLAQANSYTDLQLATLDFDLDTLRRDANSGTAAAMAIAGLPQAMEPGAGMIAGAFGVWRGETAFAIGVSKTADDGHAVIKGGATVTSRSSTFGMNVGVGYQF